MYSKSEGILGDKAHVAIIAAWAFLFCSIVPNEMQSLESILFRTKSVPLQRVMASLWG